MAISDYILLFRKLLQHMKKLPSYLNKLKINPLTTLALTLALFSGRMTPLLIHIVAALIHELSHLVMAKLLDVKVDYVEILPFGLFAKIDDLAVTTCKKEFLIAVAGPASFFLIEIFFYILFRIDLISLHSYHYAQGVNVTIVIFNLLPIYPLDGARILNVFLSYIFTMKVTHYIILFISTITLTALVMYNISNPQYLIFVYLGYLLANYFIKIPFIYIRQILSRNPADYPKIKIHNHLDFYRPYDNIIVKEGKYYLEKDIINQIIINSKNKIKDPKN